jgi:hypothetical protein
MLDPTRSTRTRAEMVIIIDDRLIRLLTAPADAPGGSAP